MTRIDFHIGVGHRVHYACRVIRKARAAQKRAVVYSAAGGSARTVRSGAVDVSALDFVPHVYAGSGRSNDTGDSRGRRQALPPTATYCLRSTMRCHRISKAFLHAMSRRASD